MANVGIAGYVGPAALTDSGTTAAFRQDKTGSLVTAPGRAPRAEQVIRGLVFSGFVPPGTGVAPGTAIGTTAALGLGNPSTSGKNLVLLEIHVNYVSGTLGSGQLMLLRHTSSSGAITAITGTAVTPTNMFLPSQTASSATLVYTATVPATGIMIRSIATLTQILATSVVAPFPIIDRVDGAVVIGPGAAVSIQAIAGAGTSPLLTLGFVWAEEAA